jgi:hypothetical protein
MLRIPTPLPDQVEQLIHDTIRCCIAVHRELGPGILENTYCRAVGLELEAACISFEREKAYPVIYRGQQLCEHRLDFVVRGEIVLESSRSSGWCQFITPSCSTTCESRPSAPAS